MEKLTLADISAQVNICPSECCRFFKKYMKESLFAYLLAFRIEKSLPLLSDPHLSITEISNQVGFASSSLLYKDFSGTDGVLSITISAENLQITHGIFYIFIYL